MTFFNLFDTQDPEFPMRQLLGPLMVIPSVIFIENMKRSKILTKTSTFIASREPLFVALGIRLGAASIATLVLIYAINLFPTLERYTSVAFLLPRFLRLLAGVGAFLMGSLLLHRVFSTLGKNYSMSLVIKDNHRLVTWGPYKYVRHPMYTALMLCGLGISIISANILMLMLCIFTMTIILKARTGKEEAMMKEHFGREYEEFMQKTTAVWMSLPQLLEVLFVATGN